MREYLQPGIQSPLCRSPSRPSPGKSFSARTPMSSKAQHEYRSSFPQGAPKDYLARRKMFRKISGIVMTALFSLLVAGLIVYWSDPNFTFLR